MDNSHEGMMSWMREFNRDFEGMVQEEIMAYLDEQMTKIENVGKTTSTANKKRTGSPGKIKQKRQPRNREVAFEITNIISTINSDLLGTTFQRCNPRRDIYFLLL